MSEHYRNEAIPELVRVFNTLKMCMTADLDLPA